jgi:antitoxin component YwqK of YwqJK toxin-antitoxin module
MNILQEALIALLSGLTHKTGNEIHWEDECGEPITVEPVDIEKSKYIVRHYYKNGNKWWEREYQNGQFHGKSFGWYENGNKLWEREYQNGQFHGKSFGCYKNGNKYWEREHQNGQKHGKWIKWCENGNKEWEREHQNGQKHGKWIKWCENGDKNWEAYYWGGKKVSEEEFNCLSDSPTCAGEVVEWKGKKYRLEEVE